MRVRGEAWRPGYLGERKGRRGNAPDSIRVSMAALLGEKQGEKARKPWLAQHAALPLISIPNYAENILFSKFSQPPLVNGMGLFCDLHRSLC
jgi:hypothetical protein